MLESNIGATGKRKQIISIIALFQDQIYKKYDTRFNIPVMHYSQLMSVAYGGSVKEAGLNGNIVRSKKLEEIASK